ncbi:MAG TPA: TetR/AcrR family transcriptional regulator, partial [Nitrospinae bacterium]|nr:TetR/AcrR family transcriptional regulator [Nitrospinota bacterium]
MNRRTATESKESILEAAIKVFSEKGYSQTTIREVAKRAGISVGGVYIYFKNKEEIYFTLLKYL